MRARSHRPTFDRLDARLVLDGGTAAITGAAMGTSVLVLNDGGSDGSTQTDLTTVIDWYLPGSPPAETYDPSATGSPLDLTP